MGFHQYRFSPGLFNVKTIYLESICQQISCFLFIYICRNDVWRSGRPLFCGDIIYVLARDLININTIGFQLHTRNNWTWLVRKNEFLSSIFYSVIVKFLSQTMEWNLIFRKKNVVYISSYKPLLLLHQ